MWNCIGPSEKAVVLINFPVFLNGPPRPLLSSIFGLFKQTSLQLLQQKYICEKCPYSIQTHDLWNMSLFP